MPHEAITVRESLVQKDTAGGHDEIIVQTYEAPASGDGGYEHDPYRERDAAVVVTMKKWLNRHYPGHPWGCVSDLRQGIVKFSIPILMGLTNWWVVNLRTTDIVFGMAQGAGQILERYRLKRGRFDLDTFLDARAKHSALVIPGRKVPE